MTDVVTETATEDDWRPPAPVASARRPDLLRWLVAFGCLAVMLATWSLSVPVFSGPDEHTHAIRAAGVARGVIVGTRRHLPGPPYEVTLVPAPGSFANATDTFNCYVGRSDRSARCGAALAGPAGHPSLATLAGRNPPLYYLVGVATWFTDGTDAVYLMRLLTATVCAALLASAVCSVLRSRRPRALLLGLLLAATPAAVYLGAVVNPSGPEVAGAVLLWCAAAVLVDGADAADLSRHVRRASIGAAVLVLSQPLSIVWLLATLTVLLVLAGRSGAAALWGKRPVRLGAGVAGAAAALAAGWVVWQRPLSVHPAPVAEGAGGVRHAIGEAPVLLRQMVGDYGFNDTHAPSFTHYVWWLGMGFVLALVILFGRRRAIVAVSVLIGLVVLLPVAFEVRHVFVPGPWIGRFTLPLAVGVPIVAMVGSGDSEAGRLVTRRAFGVIVGLVAFAHVTGYLTAMRRYAVGMAGRIVYFHGAHWSPRLSLLGLAAVFIVAVGALAAGTAVSGENPGASPTGSPDRTVTPPAATG